LLSLSVSVRFIFPMPDHLITDGVRFQ